MSQKRNTLFLLLVTLLLGAVAFFLNGDQVGFCGKLVPFEQTPSRNCVQTINRITEPFLISIIPLLIISPILFFVRREVFITWGKFALVAFPLMLGGLLYTYFSPNPVGSADLFGTDELWASIILPSLFVLISTILIVVRTVQSRKTTAH